MILHNRAIGVQRSLTRAQSYGVMEARGGSFQPTRVRRGALHAPSLDVTDGRASARKRAHAMHPYGGGGEWGETSSERPGQDRDWIGGDGNRIAPNPSPRRGGRGDYGVMQARGGSFKPTLARRGALRAP
jgi:hypothetical protein